VYVDDGHFGSALVGCSGNVSKRVYMLLFRLLHILFPTLEAWNRSILESAARVPGIRVDANAESPGSASGSRGGVVYSLRQPSSHARRNASSTSASTSASTSGSRVHGVLVKPNFLLGCLEAVRQQRVVDDSPGRDGRDDSNDNENGDDNDNDNDDDDDSMEGDDANTRQLKDAVRIQLVFEEQSCLKTVRHLDDVIGLLTNAGTLDENSTPLSSPHKHRTFSFQSPAKKPLHGDNALDVKLAVSMIEMGATSDFRDGAMFLQMACQSREKAEYAIRKGAFRALVMSSSMMLASKVMGSVEQLSILTMTASQLLDRSSASSAPERALVKEFVGALHRPTANPVGIESTDEL
jgi:hypothetical protein